MCRPRTKAKATIWSTTPMRIARTTVRGMRFLAVVAPFAGAATAGLATGGGGGVYGVYPLGGRLMVSVGGAGVAWMALHAAANWRAGAARSSRLRQRGHPEGSPARRAPQFGHSSTRDSSDDRRPKLSLKRTTEGVDPA